MRDPCHGHLPRERFSPVALSWRNLPCALKAAIGSGTRTCGTRGSLARAGGPRQGPAACAFAGREQSGTRAETRAQFEKLEKLDSFEFGTSNRDLDQEAARRGIEWMREHYRRRAQAPRF